MDFFFQKKIFQKNKCPFVPTFFSLKFYSGNKRTYVKMIDNKNRIDIFTYHPFRDCNKKIDAELKLFCQQKTYNFCSIVMKLGQNDKLLSRLNDFKISLGVIQQLRKQVEVGRWSVNCLCL